MKNNTEKSKNLIAEAIRSLPEDFTLADTKLHLLRAYDAIEEVENKRLKREGQMKKPQKGFAKVSEQRTAPQAQQRTTQNWTPGQVMGVINYIDQQILEAKQEIEEIHRKRTETPIESEIERKLLED